MSNPVLVTFGDGSYRSEIDERMSKKLGRSYGSIAIHEYCSHILGQPCLWILPPPKGSGPLVDGRTIKKVIEHETLHHCIVDLLMSDGLDWNDDTLDALLESLPYGHVLRRRLQFR